MTHSTSIRYDAVIDSIVDFGLVINIEQWHADRRQDTLVGQVGGRCQVAVLHERRRGDQHVLGGRQAMGAVADDA